MAEVRGANFEIKGLQELQSQFDRIGKMPKKYLTKAARAGIADSLRDVKASVPEGDTKILRRSIKKKMETPNKRNKGVYRIAYDAKYTPNFLKPSSGAWGGRPPNAYYPHSVEYGFKKKGGGKVPGQFNVVKALARHEKTSIEKVVESLRQSIDELLR